VSQGSSATEVENKFKAMEKELNKNGLAKKLIPPYAVIKKDLLDVSNIYMYVVVILILCSKNQYCKF